MVLLQLRISWALAWREIVRFFRQRNRVIGALGQPILFWLLFGAGLSRSFRLSPAGQSGESFLDYFFSGTLVLILLFTAIFATISIIEDRREGLLQSILVAPISRWSMVLGKVLGGTFIAFAQSMLFVALGLAWSIEVSASALLSLALLLLVTALGLTSFGFVLAWRMESTQGFHAIMNLLLMPMWLLSGAFWPIPAVLSGEGIGAIVLHWTMRLNPLSYSVAGIRNLLNPRSLGSEFYCPGLMLCWTVSIVFSIAAFAGACWISSQRTKGDLL